MNGIQEVSGSIPLISTIFKKKHNKNSFLNWKRVFVLGFTVAEIGWRWYNKANCAKLQVVASMGNDKVAEVVINIQKKPCHS